MAVVEPPAPPGAAPYPAPPSAPYAATVTCVTPAGTTKLCDAPVYPSVTVPVHLPGPHEHMPPIGQLVAQSAQTPPVPHAIVVVPAAHVPFFAAEQQPPLHACVEEHAVVQAWVVVSQACLVGQSAAVLQHPLPIVQPASCATSTLPTSFAVIASPPSGAAVAPSSDPASPARMRIVDALAIAAHPPTVSASASAVGAEARAGHRQTPLTVSPPPPARATGVTCAAASPLGPSSQSVMPPAASTPPTTNAIVEAVAADFASSRVS